MPIGNLSNKVSREDIERVRRKNNPPEYEPGFEPEDSDDSFDDIFSDDGDIEFDDIFDGEFGASDSSESGGFLDGSFGGEDSFGGGSLGGTSFGNNSFGNSIFGNNSFDNSIFGRNTLGNYQLGNSGIGINNQKVANEDRMDKVIDATVQFGITIWNILVELFKSVRNRNADDFAYISRNLIITGIVFIAGSILLSIIGTAINIRFIRLGGLAGQTLGCGILLFGTGLIGIGFSAIRVAYTDRNVKNTSIQSLPDVSDIDSSDNSSKDNIDSYEENIDDILDDLLSDGSIGNEGDDFFDGGGSYDNEGGADEVYNANFDDINNNENSEESFKSKVDKIRENMYITREVLVDTFKDFFPVCTPNFADKRELDKNSDEFETIETICLKALSNVTNTDIEDLDTYLESVYESYFSYELRLKRLRRVNNLDDIAREMEAYFRESSTDTSVNAVVDIEGDFYKIVVTKGVTTTVTFGDIFKQEYVQNYFYDVDNTLPIIVGISELGKVILEDAKDYDTMLISGKPRSGKSWYVLAIMLSLMMFNTPEDVQFIIVDPKESNLFKTLGLMPHVCGVHNDEKILEIMEDIINNEGARRKKLLSDHKCDDIWALWEKGIKLPVLYLFIDEVITVKNNLGSLDKKFDELMQIIISQLPSLGIRLIMVPHRSTGIIDKTNRTMISFSAAIRANIEDIKETLGIKKWTRQLVNKGDVAVKYSNNPNPLYVRGAAVARNDNENVELILNAAKAFYKMGVDIPDMSSMEVACNRDEGYIREVLSGGGNRVQYNADNIFDGIGDIDEGV